MARARRDGNDGDPTPGFRTGKSPAGRRWSLRTLGRLALLDADGCEDPSLATRPRKLALLAWLALRPGSRATRDRIIGVFWGGRSEERARNSLSDALSHLRRPLGRDTILAQADEVLVAADAPLDVDALALARAHAAGDHARVVALYAGPFLDGVYVDDAPEFEEWRDRERARLSALFARSAAVHCAELARTRRWDECRALAERWLDAEPASAEAALFLLEAIDAPGSHAAHVATLAAYDVLVRRLEREVGVAPDGSVTAFAREVTARLAASPPAVHVEVVGALVQDPRTASADDAPRAPAPVVPEDAIRHARAPFRRRTVAAYLVGVLAVAIALLLPTRRGEAPTLAPRRVVVARLENRTGDSTLAPIGRIAADWITRGLVETRRLEVEDPITAQAEPSRDPRVIGRDAGAAIVVIGAYFRHGDSLGLEARVVDATSGRVLREVEPATGPLADPLVAVDRLRQRVAGALAAELDGRIAGLAREASQPPTYEAYLAWVQGLDAYSDHDFTGAIPLFMRAASLDADFAAPRLWAAAAYGNLGDFVRCDSILRAVDSTRARLAPLDRGLLEVWQASVRGDNAGQYAAAREMLAAAPASELAMYLAGITALHVGRPNEAVALLRRIPVERSGVAWDVYGTQLTVALHQAGRYDEELAEARRRRAHQPTSIRALEDEARSLAALGRLDDVERRMTEVATLPAQAGRSAGVVMYFTAQELRAHGHESEAVALFRRVADWARTRPGSSTPSDRFLLARARYQAGDFAAADSLFRALSATNPRSVAVLGWLGATAAWRGDEREAQRISATLAALDVPYLHGANTMARARIAAVLGRRDDAVHLARQALAEGQPFDELHSWMELLPLRGYPPFEVLLHPA